MQLNIIRRSLWCVVCIGLLVVSCVMRYSKSTLVSQRSDKLVGANRLLSISCSALHSIIRLIQAIECQFTVFFYYINLQWKQQQKYFILNYITPFLKDLTFFKYLHFSVLIERKKKKYARRREGRVKHLI